MLPKKIESIEIWYTLSYNIEKVVLILRYLNVIKGHFFFRNTNLSYFDLQKKIKLATFEIDSVKPI